MKANIVLGGLLGLALGAGTVFAVAHGVFPSAPVESSSTNVDTSSDDASVSTDSVGFDAPIETTPHRPLRPGSARIGLLPPAPLLDPAQS